MFNNKFYNINILSEDLKVKRSSIIYLLGYKDAKIVSKSIIKKIDYYIKKCIDICAAKGCYLFIDKISINNKNGSIKLHNLTFYVGQKITAQLKFSKKLVLFICTSGDKIEAFSKKLIGNNKYLEGYIVDLIGSEITEAIADLIHQRIIEKAKLMKLKTTNRFSPGYCEWDVIEQFKLFKLFSDNTCSISLTEKGLMKPIKSISGIIGIGKNVKLKDHTCALCTYKSCNYKITKDEKKIYKI